MSAPDFRNSAPLPADPTDHEAMVVTWLNLCSSSEEAKCKFVRMTIVNDEFPNADVPHGCYVEGWFVRPDEQPPFEWPETNDAG